MDAVDVTPSGDAYIDSLAHATKWAGTALTYSFPTSAAQFTGYGPGSEPFDNFAGFNAQQQDAVRWALAQVASFTNLTFSESKGADASTAVLRFGMSDAPETAWGFLPDPADLGGDAWFNTSSGDYDAPVRGNYAWHGILHEIGHTLGLDHPHESDPPMPLDRDWMAYTVMSYRSYMYQSVSADSTYTNGDWGYAQSYMMEDIAALQQLYGANFNFRNDDTTYSWNPATGEMSVAGVEQGTPGANAIFMTIWDGGGNDTFDFSNYTTGATIDLNPGSYINLHQQSADLGGGLPPGQIATALLYHGDPRSLIENAIGTSGSDTISGNIADNLLVGGAGNDEIHAGDGNDTLAGGDGDDHLNGDAGNDTLHGNDGQDYLVGDAGNDLLFGDAGNDTLRGGPGDDVLDGGVGDDYLVGADGNDTLYGGGGDDTLAGDTGTNAMYGGPGNDTYVLDNPTDQTVEAPGEGIDTISIQPSGALGGTYTLGANIENATVAYNAANVAVTGNALDNTIHGNVANNVIDGGSGADLMFGGNGDDTYYVDNENDKVYETDSGPFDWVDTVYSSVNFVAPDRDPYFILNDSYGFYAGAWTSGPRVGLGDIEVIILTGSANLTATGDGSDNSIKGNSGNNTLNGLDGNDILDGGAGNDILISGSGSDTLRGDVGSDAMFFGANLEATDAADGGDGFDQVGLQGNYWAGLTFTAANLAHVEQLVLLSGNDTRFGDTAGNYYSYNLTTVDANVAAGQILYVSFNTLRLGENVVFNGAAESDGAFITYGGQGGDTILGSQQSDGFFFGNGTWGQYDSVFGQGGALDQLGLQGNYTAAGSGAIVFGAAQLGGIEVIVCITGGDARFGAPAGEGYSYDLTMNDANVRAGQTMYISANRLQAAGGALAHDETLTFDGSHESDGSFVIYSGSGADHIVGGAGGDTIYGGGGADQLTGGAGNDVFAYVSADHSTASAMDQILDFATGDTIDLARIDAATGSSDDPFHFVGATAFSSTAGELRAFQQSPGHWQVEGDINGDGTADLVIGVTTDHGLSATDFVL